MKKPACRVRKKLISILNRGKDRTGDLNVGKLPKSIETKQRKKQEKTFNLSRRPEVAQQAGLCEERSAEHKSLAVNRYRLTDKNRRGGGSPLLQHLGEGAKRCKNN